MTQVRNEKQIGETITVYRMARRVAGQWLGVDTAVTECELLHHRDLVARRLRDSRRYLRAAVARVAGA